MLTKTKVIRNMSVNICFLIFKTYDIFTKAVHNVIRFCL